MTPQEIQKASGLVFAAQRAAENLSRAKTAGCIDELDWFSRQSHEEVQALRAQMLEACRAIALDFYAGAVTRARVELAVIGVDLTDQELAAHVAKVEDEQQRQQRRAADEAVKKVEEAAR